MAHLHAEVEYGSREGHVHSDVCKPDDMDWPEYRRFIHDVLDELLDKLEDGQKGSLVIQRGYSYSENTNRPTVIEAAAV